MAKFLSAYPVFNMKRIKCLTVAAGLLVFATATAQKMAAEDDGWQLGIGIGYTNYYGDLSNYRINTFKDFNKVYRFADFNHYYIPQPSVSLLLEKKINPTLGLLLQFNRLSFSMSDRYRNKDGSIDPNAINFSRSLNFKTTLYDAGFALSFSAANGQALKVNSFFYPSFYIGGGVSLFNVYGDLYDANGNAYQYNQPNNINDGSFETNLRDVKTETYDRYNNIVPYLNLGLSLNFRIAANLRLSVQSDIKYAGTDYLDDVSSRYKATYPSSAAAYAAHPGYNNIDPVSLQRGDSPNMNDIYINNRLVLHIGFGQKKKQTVFRAPVIYALSSNNAYYKTVDSVNSLSNKPGIKDTIKTILKDSLTIKQDSIPLQRSDTAYQQRMEQKLDSVQLQLKQIKTVIRNQGYEARYQYLRYKQDSLQQLKKLIRNQKIISREDNLRIRIYDLQTDSLRNEMLLLQRRAEAGFDASDSSWRSIPAYQLQLNTVKPPTDMVKPSIDSSAKTTTAIGATTDSLTDQQINNLSQQFSALQNDQRYSKDSIYRKTIDSLHKKLDAFEKAKLHAAAQQRSADSLTPLQYQDQPPLGVDSARHPSARNDTSRAIINHTNPGDSIRSDTANERMLLRLQTDVQKNTDSLVSMKKLIRQKADSASFYRQQALAARSSADSAAAVSKKWYQRILPGNTKKQSKVREETIRVADEQSQYYDQQLNRLTSQVNDLQQRNQSLNNDYERTRRRRDERVYTPTPTVVRESNYSSRQTDDLRDLRNEINGLRNQLLTQQAIGTALTTPVYREPQKTKADTVYIGMPKADSVTHSSDPQVVAMQLEIARLKGQLDVLTAPIKPAAATKPVSGDLTVYFRSGASVLSKDQLTKLDALQQATENKAGQTITLTGYTDASGNAAINNALAKKRVSYIQRLLVGEYAVPIDRIQLNEPVKGSAVGNRKALDRKVVIAFK